jgi:hypothetical protein
LLTICRTKFNKITTLVVSGLLPFPIVSPGYNVEIEEKVAVELIGSTSNLDVERGAPNSALLKIELDRSLHTALVLTVEKEKEHDKDWTKECKRGMIWRIALCMLYF